MITAIRYPSLDDDLTLPLVCTSYFGHPPSTNGTGTGVAATILAAIRSIGLTSAHLRSQLRGGTFDGGLIGVHVSCL